ncbi:hypothetical protein ONS95_006051 [Cadophora gregata]|uniref:uncharacterized protein n=1 Tax=Cadophora gregata TaxID=51156 RepID=UPI0026DC8993|nr:uncharacterized protein ONS95_006051 [Cadophora gregata]KAK0102431.1 hypothetical protein ONS95_006051 [Cadophora gregata]KAK0104058.1 hypothetical protein ONS96_005160 [Cadophora gregata f. sp. sojae]
MAEIPSQEAGGFLPPSLPSPAPSNYSTSSTASNLPHPRANPLRHGSAKEDAARRYLEARLLNVSRRYAKKFQPMEEGDDIKGYVHMSEVAKDLADIVDVVWLSGTPSLQIPYLLNTALAVNTYTSAFPAAPKATFALIRKLDHAFSSLLKGEDSVTGEILPGFSGGKKAGLTKTDMVRCKGLVDSARVLIVDVMGTEIEEDADDESGTEMETDGETSTWGDAADGKWEMDIAKVYEMTIVELGAALDTGDAFAVDPSS